MADRPKIYVTTEKAGFVVAGRRIPGEYRDAKDKDGKLLTDAKGAPLQEFRPKIGVELELLEIEAQYELAQGTIALKERGPGSKTEPRGGKSKSEPSADPANAA